MLGKVSLDTSSAGMCLNLSVASCPGLVGYTFQVTVFHKVFF